MRKLLHYLILITILSGILLAGCNQEPAQETTGDMENNGPYADIEDGLVGETKALAQQMAEFAESEEIMLYTTDADIAENISAFASAVLQCNEPLSATRYIVDRNSISQNPSGGAMSHEEILSYCAQLYPSMINQRSSVAAMTAASILNIETAYPLPADFTGIQIIELRYTPDVGVFAVYTETENGTVQCEVSPLLGKIEENDSFVNIASSGNIGISFQSDVSNCDPTVSCSILECERNRDANIFSSENPEVAIAQATVRLVGKRASIASLGIIDGLEALSEYCLSCQYTNNAPTSAIIYPTDNLHELYGLDKSLVDDNTPFKENLVLICPHYLCGRFGNVEMLASQSIMGVTTSFQTDRSIESAVVWLIYEDENDISAGMVSILPVSSDCVLVHAAPLWNLPVAAEVLAFYETGEPINKYYKAMNNWLASGEYVEIQQK
ncbi:MAG TPA: hypothetical protein DEF06_10870 [Clostridiales bacterium]|uniref:Lipoprotein n=1 Tax=Candidatus Egerieisoma faecipullorum TaxID=2840963 RepID=A0A9D1L9V9_9CLOT|nr:hypothetical protein [Clostridiales bacterium]HIU29286.1 hypothetical protein [Candidatus Egerieisoma faecipullorum]